VPARIRAGAWFEGKIGRRSVAKLPEVHSVPEDRGSGLSAFRARALRVIGAGAGPHGHD
jgi:hypothetical protein